MSDLPRCPACQVRLRLLYDKTNVRPVSYCHPPNDGLASCEMAGRSIGVELLPLWKKPRPGPALYMEVIDNRPVFNDEERGERVDAALLNSIINYYAGIPAKEKENG